MSSLSFANCWMMLHIYSHAWKSIYVHKLHEVLAQRTYNDQETATCYAIQWETICVIASQCIKKVQQILRSCVVQNICSKIFVWYETFLYHLKNRIVLSSTRRQLESTLCEVFLYVNLNHNNFTFLFHFM